MPKHLLIKLPLFLIAFTSTTFSLSPNPQSILCPLAAWADTREFGQDGRDGNSGRSGRKGRDGENQTIFTEGTPVNLELSGQDGEDGEDGDRGYDALCNNQPRNVPYDVNAPDGGDGGNGGRGGDGGNGGSVTVYYTNPADLNKISVRAPGGEGGRGGRGAYGGEGCNCRKRDWEITTCTGKPGEPNHSCKTRRYNCRDGKDGNNGNYGGDGSDGRLGILTLINRQELLPEDAPTKTVAIADLKNQTFNLSKNKWVTRTGAASLLASGSVIANEYREFVERIEGSFQLVWNAAEPITNFARETATFTLNDEGQVEISFPEDVWVDSTQSQQGNLTQLIVSHAIRKSDVTKLSVADFAQTGKDITFNLVDLAGKSDLISTDFRIKYRTKGDPFNSFGDYQTRYEGVIPAELITRDYNRFVLAVGKLPIASEYLRRDTQVEIELVATRSFAGRSTEQKIRWQGRVKG